MYKKLSQLTVAIQHKTVIGITGHRDIVPGTEGALKLKLSDKIKILAKDGEHCLLLTCLASGADQIAAEAAIEAGIPFIVLLPMREEYYEHDFHEENERTRFEKLLTKKHDVITIDETLIEKYGDERSNQYKNAGHLIAICSDHLLALWDGVYTGECGGTSEIVRIALSGIQISDENLSGFNSLKKSSACVHHLLTPRQRNPFPVTDPKFSFFPLKELEWGNVNIPLPVSKQPGRLQVLFRRYKEFLIKFIIPLLLVLVTLILGHIGFSQYKSEYSWLDAFFAAANLITLNASVLNNLASIPFPLQIARITGLLTAIYAIAGAFLWAASGLRKRVLIFTWGGDFNLVIGLNEKSFNLIKDLRSRNLHTVVLNDNAGSSFIKSCEYLGAIVYQGNATEISDLNYVYFKKAKNIYVFTENDSDNVRVMQEIDKHVSHYGRERNRAFYIHVNDLKQKEFLARTTRSDVSIFNIYENAVRRLLMKHPLDRFLYSHYSSIDKKAVQVIIIGFDRIAWELTLAVLRMGHYTTNISLELIIFTDGEEQRERSEKFKERYGRIFSNSSEINEDIVFLQQTSAKLVFETLSDSDAALTDPQNSPVLNRINISAGASINIFTCLADSLKSAAYLSLLLPRLDYLKINQLLNMQVFCYYNSPDETEEEYIEYQINKIGTHVPVYCFGNFLKTCTEEVIQSHLTDQLAKQLAFWYYLIYSFIYDTSELSKEICETYNERVLTLKGKDMMNWMKETASYLQKTDTLIEERIRIVSELLDFFWEDKSLSEIKDRWNKSSPIVIVFVW